MAMSIVYTVWDGQVVSENRGGVERDYIPEPLGNTIALVDSNHTVTDTWTYWPYGEVLSHAGTSTTPFTFLGTLGYLADSIALLYVRMRHVRSDLTRWMTRDPFWPKQRPYSYTASRPITFVDPSGGALALIPILVFWPPKDPPPADPPFQLPPKNPEPQGPTISNSYGGGCIWPVDPNDQNTLDNFCLAQGSAGLGSFSPAGFNAERCRQCCWDFGKSGGYSQGQSNECAARCDLRAVQTDPPGFPEPIIPPLIPPMFPITRGFPTTGPIYMPPLRPFITPPLWYPSPTIVD